jgi:hypothetical protein
MNFTEALSIVKANPKELLLKPVHWEDEAFIVEGNTLKLIPTSCGGRNWMTYHVPTLLGEWVVVDWNFKVVQV